jgi:peptide-methionine (S)-S-oxide reductase
METEKKQEVATFGSGCFWCTEAVFERLEGVDNVVSGFSGGKVKNPSYREITTGRTGHAEVCQIYYDPDIVSYKELLEVFWYTHDPTTLNRQGNDVGPQYRSVIFYHSEEQKNLAEKSLADMDASGFFKDPIVTEITGFTNFYEAEDYHQDYFKNNPNAPYCTFVVKPKVDKFKAKFQDKLK